MPLVRDLAAEGIPVVVTCEVLGFSPQAFYKWQTRPYSDRDWDDAVLLNAIAPSIVLLPMEFLLNAPWLLKTLPALPSRGSCLSR